jgi:hypothetical protein
MDGGKWSAKDLNLRRPGPNQSFDILGKSGMFAVTDILTKSVAVLEIPE